MKKAILIVLISSFILLLNDSVSTKSKKAPGFALFNLKGRLITLSTLTKNSNIILSFWASYCKPCIREMPQLVELEKTYKKTKNITLVLVNIDKEGKEKALPILKDLSVDNECLLDIYQLTAKKYIPDLKVPALFLINKSGTILFEAVGEKQETLQNLEMFIKRIR